MKNTQDLIIIGGGIMGLMTAYYAADYVSKITILEKRTSSSDNKESASFSNTRSIRTDFLEPEYAQLAYESRSLWIDLEKKAKQELFVKAGCLNIAKKSITPDFAQTYAAKSFQNISQLGYQPKKFNSAELRKTYPQFDADFATLDVLGGYLDLQKIAAFLLRELKEKGVTLIENIDIQTIEETTEQVLITTNKGDFNAKNIVITAGKGTNPLLEKIMNNALTFPIKYTRPERRYYYPEKEIAKMFLPENIPVFAYTDTGIYGHPIYDAKKGAVKVAYFEPVGFKKDESKITCVQDFVNECLPQLKNVPSEDIPDVDLCWYDIVSDDNFIIGKLPKYQRIVIGTGFRGTGYKYGPLVGKILSQLSLQDRTVYDIELFSPERFAKE